MKTGTRHRYTEYGQLCCECPAMDERDDLPEGYHLRFGKGQPPFAFHQDCAQYPANADRIQVIETMTNTGVNVPVLQLIGDGLDANGLVRTGGVYALRPLTHPTNWDSGSGIRTRFTFSPQSPLEQAWYFNYEIRGQLAPKLHNEVVEALNVTIKNNLVKIMYFVDAVDGQGGGSRHVEEFPFSFKQFGWYELNTAMKAVPDLVNTWDLMVQLQKITPRGYGARRVEWSAPPELRPNAAISLTAAGCGDEQQGLPSGGTFLVSVNEDSRMESHS